MKNEGWAFTYMYFISFFQACAPRYVYYIYMDRKDPVGMCYSTRSDFTHVRAHKPCVESGRVSFRGRIRPPTILIVLFFSFPSLRVRTKTGLRASLRLVFAQLQATGAHWNLFHSKKWV